MIVIEGMDNSGKSTLAKLLNESLGWRIISSEGPEKYAGELEERVATYGVIAMAEPIIFDRHPCVSDPIYSHGRRKPTALRQATINHFYEQGPFFVYCDIGSRGMIGHQDKPHDTAEHLNMVRGNFSELRQLYRNWAVNTAHYIYRIGDQIDPLLTLLRDFDPIRDVSQFMEKFEQHYIGKPRALPDVLSRFREDFMDEELGEYKKHARALEALLDETPIDEAAITHHLAEMLDAICDKLYIDIGTALLHGFDHRIFSTAWQRVHAANMKKEKVLRRSDSTRFSIYDVRKPIGFVAPDHKDLVEDHRHRNS